MTPSSFSYSYETGKMYGRVYQIGVRADSTLNSANSFAAVLFYEQEDGGRVQIARIDNTEHEGDDGETHIDRLYREEGADRKDYDIDISDPFEADHYLSERWERFAQQHESNHGH